MSMVQQYRQDDHGQWQETTDPLTSDEQAIVFQMSSIRDLPPLDGRVWLFQAVRGACPHTVARIGWGGSMICDLCGLPRP